MIQSSTQPPTTYREQIALLRDSKGLLKLFGYLAVVYFLAPIILGLVFTMMMFPLTLALVRLGFVWTPVYHLAGRVMGVKGLPDHLAKPPTWFMIYSVVWVGVMFAIVAYCVWILLSIGFCSQNLACMLGNLRLKQQAVLIQPISR